WFETDVVKASLCSSGIIGTLLGPRSPGTAYVLMHHYMGEIDGAYRSWGYVRGGMGMVSESIARAARLFGAEIRVNAEVRRILVQDGRAIGVELASGEKLYAKVIASGADPKRTFLKMIERSDLPADFVPPRQWSPSPGRHLDRTERGLHRKSVRRCEVRRLLAPTLCRHVRPVDARSNLGAAGQTPHVVFHPICPVHVAKGHVGGTARRVRGHGPRHP